MTPFMACKMYPALTTLSSLWIGGQDGDSAASAEPGDCLGVQIWTCWPVLGVVKRPGLEEGSDCALSQGTTKQGDEVQELSEQAERNASPPARRWLRPWEVCSMRRQQRPCSPLEPATLAHLPARPSSAAGSRHDKPEQTAPTFGLLLLGLFHFFYANKPSTQDMFYSFSDWLFNHPVM